MNPYLIFVARRRWPILLLLPLVVLGAVLFLTPTPKPEPTRYTTKVYIGANPDGSGAVGVQQAALEVKQDVVSRLAAEKLGEEITDPKDFAKPLRVRVQVESLTLELSASDPDRERVAEYTSAFAQAFVEANDADLTQDRQAELDVLTAARNAAQLELTTFLNDNRPLLEGTNPDVAAVAQRSALAERLTGAEERLRAATDAPVVGQFEIKGVDPVTKVAAEKLQLPASRAVRAIMALLLGLLGAVGLVAFIEKLNPRVDRPAEAEDIVGASVLAMVPVIKGKGRRAIERATLAEFSGPFAESFRAMRSHLDFRSTVEQLDRPPCVMVVSSAPNEGKTTTSAFLAVSYAELGRDVVVVGADFRRPAVHRMFDVPRTPGLSSRLFDGAAGPVASMVKRDPETGVRVVPSGPGTDRVSGLLGELASVTTAGQESGCTMVLDTAPVMVANDAIDFLPLVDWVVVVVRLGQTTKRALRQTIQSLDLNEARIAGCVVVGSLESSDSKRYYYSYYNVDDDTRAEKSNKAARRARSELWEGDGFPTRPGDEPEEAPAPTPSPTPAEVEPAVEDEVASEPAASASAPAPAKRPRPRNRPARRTP